MRTHLLLVASLPAALAACLLPEPSNMAARSDGGGTIQTVSSGDGGAPDAQLSSVDAQTADAQILPCTAGAMNVSDPATGHCYMYFASQLDWLDSRIACTALGARTHLATVTSAAEQAVVAPLVTANDTWIGLDDNQTEGSFLWTTGEPLGYTNWAPGEPNNGAGGDPENCAILRGGSAQWDDRDCSLTYNYVCERD